MVYRGVEGSPEGDKPEIGKTLERLGRTRYSTDIKIEPAQALDVKVGSTTVDVYWIWNDFVSGLRIGDRQVSVV